MSDDLFPTFGGKDLKITHAIVGGHVFEMRGGRLIEPAMTSVEWEWHFTHHNPDRADPFFDADDYVDQPGAPHEVAALLLYKQPFGFAREDVTTLRKEYDAIMDAQSDEYWDTVAVERATAFQSLADRIEALLPPE